MTRAACSVTVAALLAAVGACSSRHAPPHTQAPGRIVAGGAGHDGDVVVTLADCPPEVQRTINERLGGGVIREIERTTDHGEALYEVDVAMPHGIVEFDVAADGAFRGYEEGDDDDDGPGEDDDVPDDDDDDLEIPLSEVPQKAVDAALAAVPGIVLEEASVEMEDG